MGIVLFRLLDAGYLFCGDMAIWRPKLNSKGPIWKSKTARHDLLPPLIISSQ